MKRYTEQQKQIRYNKKLQQKLAKLQKKINDHKLKFQQDQLSCIYKQLDINNTQLALKILEYLHKACQLYKYKSFTKQLQSVYIQKLAIFKLLIKQFGQYKILKLIHSIHTDDEFIQFIYHINYQLDPVLFMMFNYFPIGVGRGQILLQILCERIVISGQNKDFDITYIFDNGEIGKFEVKYGYPVRIAKDSRYLKTMRVIYYLVSILDQRRAQICNIVDQIQDDYIYELYYNKLYKYLYSNFISMQLSQLKSEKFKVLQQYILFLQQLWLNKFNNNQLIYQLYRLSIQDQTYVDYVKNFKSFDMYLNNQLLQRVSHNKPFLFFNNGRIIFTDQIKAHSITCGTVKIEPQTKEFGIYIKNQKIKKLFKL